MGFFDTLGANLKQLFSKDSADNLGAAASQIQNTLTSPVSTTPSPASTGLDVLKPMSVQPNYSSQFGPAAVTPGGTYVNTQQGALKIDNFSTPTNQSIAPNMSTLLGPGRSVNGQIQVNPAQVIQPRPLIPSNTGGLNYQPTPYRAVSGTTGNSGFSSSLVPTNNANSTPSTGFMGGGSFQFGQSGTTGIGGGGSNFTGNLGGSGGTAGQNGALTTSNDEAIRKETERKNQLSLVSVTNAPSPVAPITGTATKPPASYANTSTGTAPSQFSVNAPSSTIPVGESLTAARQTITNLLSGGKISSQTANEFYTQIDNFKNQLHLEELKNNPLQAEPHVVETPDQIDWLSQFPPQEQASLQSQMDAYRSQIGLPQTEAEIFNKQAEINATSKAFQEIVKDIRDNPDLPKGLASKRITDFTNKNGILLQNLNAELSNLLQKRSFANDQLNSQFQIFQADQSQRNRVQDDARALLNIYIQSGAIGQMNAKTIGDVSKATGISVAALNSIKSSVVEKAKAYSNVQTTTDDRGTVTVFGVKNDGTVDILKTLTGAGKATKDTTFPGETGFSDKQIKQIESSPEAKKLLALRDLVGKLDAYKETVNQSGGFDVVGSRKAILDSQYADLKIAYKEAANLGALTGPDVAIIQEAIKPSSGITNILGYLSSGGQKGVIASIDTALETARRQADNNYNTLTSKWGANDPYIQQLAQGLTSGSQTSAQTVNIGGQQVQVGATITNYLGQKGRVNADGTITPL